MKMHTGEIGSVLEKLIDLNSRVAFVTRAATREAIGSATRRLLAEYGASITLLDIEESQAAGKAA